MKLRSFELRFDVFFLDVAHIYEIEQELASHIGDSYVLKKATKWPWWILRLHPCGDDS